MVDADGRDGGARVPTAAFSRLSATNVLFGWTWPQIGVGLAGLVMVVGGAAAGMVLPLMLAGGVVMAYGLIRYEGLSLMAWTYVWLAWRRRVRDGSTRWSASPLASGRPAGVLGVWGQVGSRAQVVCVCSIESGPCERVDVFHVSGRFWSTSACGEKRTPARPAWTSFPS